MSFNSVHCYFPLGLITLAGSLDWIEQDLYTFEVTATDGDGQSAAYNAQVTITVAGPDVSAPTFDTSFYSFTVEENAANTGSRESPGHPL